MTLIELIRKDQLTARQVKDSITAALLTTLIAEAEAVGKKSNRKPYDDEVVAVVKKFLKNNAEFTAANPNPDRLKVLNQEKGILESYLPKQLTETELRTIITDLKPAEMSAVMAYLKVNFGGRYDGKLASSLAREILND